MVTQQKQFWASQWSFLTRHKFARPLKTWISLRNSSRIWNHPCVIGTQILSSALAPLEVTDLHHPFPIVPSSYLHIYYISIRFNRVRTISCVPTLWNGVRKTQYSRDVKGLKLEWGNTHSLSTLVATPTHQNHTSRHFSSQNILENSKTWHQKVKPIDKMSIILL